MEAITVVLLALLGLAAGRNILYLEKEVHLQVSEEISRNTAYEAKAPITEAEEMVNVQHPETQTKKPFIDDKMVELIFKDLNSKPAVNEKLVMPDTGNAEIEKEVSPVEVGKDDEMAGVEKVLGDRAALGGSHCPGGIWIGDHCEPVDDK